MGKGAVTSFTNFTPRLGFFGVIFGWKCFVETPKKIIFCMFLLFWPGWWQSGLFRKGKTWCNFPHDFLPCQTSSFWKWNFAVGIWKKSHTHKKKLYPLFPPTKSLGKNYGEGYHTNSTPRVIFGGYAHHGCSFWSAKNKRDFQDSQCKFMENRMTKIKKFSAVWPLYQHVWSYQRSIQWM